MRFVLIALLALAGTGTAYAGCPDGFTFNTTMGKCEIAPSCPKGFVLHPVQDICTAKPDAGKCPKGSAYNEKESACESQLICPTGTIFIEQIGKCILQ